MNASRHKVKRTRMPVWAYWLIVAFHLMVLIGACLVGFEGIS
ncbi:MAG: hypothetical protein ACRBHB_17110 [Arenicella sp.]